MALDMFDFKLIHASSHASFAVLLFDMQLTAPLRKNKSTTMPATIRNLELTHFSTSNVPSCKEYAIIIIIIIIMTFIQTE